jgi:hypothetical protein
MPQGGTLMTNPSSSLLTTVHTGLYITGGLTPKNIDLISTPDGPFLHAFKDKVLIPCPFFSLPSPHSLLSVGLPPPDLQGRVSQVLDTIPMFAVMIDNVGQRGAHRVAYLDYYEVTAAAAATKTTSVEPKNRSPSPAATTGGCCLASPLLGLAAIVSVTFYAIARYR